MSTPTTFKPGALAYYDSCAGLIKCKVTHVSAGGQVEATVTAKRGPYQRGERIPFVTQTWIVPRSHVRRFGGVLKVVPGYVWVHA